MTLILIIVWAVALVALIAASSVASYLRLLMRRLTPMAGRVLFQANEGRKIQADRERVGVSISALHGAAMALFAIGLSGLMVNQQPEHLTSDLGVSLLIVLGVISPSWSRGPSPACWSHPSKSRSRRRPRKNCRNSFRPANRKG
jgi:hypothetical protein